MIMKYLQGGDALPPFVSYKPVTVTGRAAPFSTTKEDSKEESSDLTDKDLLKMLLDLDGLPSDMKVVTLTLLNFYIDQSYGLPSTSSVATRYLQVLDKMKIANANKKEYDNAFDIVSKNGGINELAISDRGLLYCVNNEGDFKLLSLEELKQNSEYQALTNSDLLYYRYESPKLANNNELIKVIRNGIGMEAVTKMILDEISKLGSTLLSLEGYRKTKTGKLINGLEDFMKASEEASGELLYDGTVHDLYKYKFLNKDQASQAQAAIKYIYLTLPENAKTLLKSKMPKKDDLGAYDLIASLVASQVSSSKDFSLDLVGGTTAKANTKDTMGKDNTNLKTSLLLEIMKSQGGYDLEMSVDIGNGNKMSVSGTYFELLKTTEGTPIINTSLESMLATTGILSIVKNAKNITFGDLKLDQSLLANITYNNTGLMRANLPVNEDGTVRLEILEDYELALAEIKLEGDNISKEKMIEIYNSHNLGDLLLTNGMLNSKKFAPFVITLGYTTENNNIKDSKFVYNVKNVTDLLLELIKESLSTGSGKDKKVSEIGTFNWANPFDYFGVEDIYKAAVYIPISVNVNSAVLGANLTLDFDESLVQEEKYRNFEKRSGVSTTSSNVL